ncbi:Superoxide dismutase [Cu-Zn] [Pyricularia oryzae]|nr:Superoxide dismutase [Cu-Zn] [Pyricularia oryzae]
MVKAVAVLRPDPNATVQVSGHVIFEQESESSPTKVTWDFKGCDANAKRAFHIHTFGDNTNGCTSAGPHFNPITRSTAPPKMRTATLVTLATSILTGRATPVDPRRTSSSN